MRAKVWGRERELAALRRALRDGQGAVLVGDAGIGKSRLAAALTAPGQHPAHWVSVTAEAARLPLGPLVTLAPEIDRALAGGDHVTGAFSVVRRYLAPDDDGSPPLLVVDDAHLLDPISAAVVHQLAVSGSAIVVATVRAGVAPPDAVTALWKDGLCLRVDLDPLSRKAADALCADLLGGPVTPAVRQRAWQLARGNPLLLRELLLAAREADTLVQERGRWILTGPVTPSRRLVDLVEARLGRLPASARYAAEVLAAAEPVDARVLATVIGSDDLVALEDAGLVTMLTSGPTPTAVELSHPLYGEVLRSTTPLSRRRRLTIELADAHEHLPDAVVDPLRLALWRADAGRAGTEELTDAALLAYGRMAYDHAALLSRAATARDAGVEAEMVLGLALGALGEADEAERVLHAAVEHAGDDGSRRTRAVVALASIRFAVTERMQGAFAVLGDELGRADVAQADRGELAATLATFRMLRGELREAAALAGPLVDDPHLSTRTRVLALATQSLCDAMGLRPEDARTRVAQALDLLDEVEHLPPHTEELLHANRYAADLYRGDLDGLAARLARRRAAVLDDGLPGVPGLWAYFEGALSLCRGELDRCAVQMREAARLLDHRDELVLRPLVLVEAALAAAVAGQRTEALAHLVSLPGRVRQTPRVGARYELVQAWLAVTDQGIEEAVAAATVAGDKAAADGISSWALDAWHVAVRLGSPDGVLGRLEDLAEAAQGDYPAAVVDHARAAAAHDPSRLMEVASRFRAMGFGLLAAEAALQAAAEHEGRGAQRNARQAASLAREMLPSGVASVTPILMDLATGPVLTTREREIALLAAQGLTSREIAERLILSPRTVDNRLAGVYAKLGITSRAELPRLLLDPE